MSNPIRVLVLSALMFSLTIAAAFAQAPAAEPPAGPWTQQASAGLALTSGNKDTSTVNAGYEVVYDPKTRNLWRTDGLFLRGKSEGLVTADRLQLNGRDEYQLMDGVYAFGQLQYLRDQFKDIDYLFAPTGGLGYRIIDSPTLKLSVDGGLGAVWEKKPLLDVQTSGAVTWSEKLIYPISSVVTITQGVAALYRADNFDDALYTFNTALAASMTEHTQLKVELLDIYKRIVAPGIENNDVAVIVGVVFKR